MGTVFYTGGVYCIMIRIGLTCWPAFRLLLLRLYSPLSDLLSFEVANDFQVPKKEKKQKN